MQKKILAVDLDEVLVAQNESLTRFHNRLFGTSHTVNDYHNDWPILWGVDEEEAERRAALWHGSKEWEAMPPIPGALEALTILKSKFKIYMITARSKKIAPASERWLQKYFPNIADEVYFMGLYEEGKGAVKAELCQELSVDFLIDDDVAQAEASAALGITVLLFGDYSWNKAEVLPKNIIRISDWQKVLTYFNE